MTAVRGVTSIPAARLLFQAMQEEFFRECLHPQYGRDLLACDRTGRRSRRNQTSRPPPLPPLPAPPLCSGLPSRSLLLGTNPSSALRPSAHSKLFLRMYRLTATIDLAS